MKPNEWLEDKEFLDRLDYHNKHYFIILAKHIANFTRNAPIALLTSWDAVHKSIYVTIGEHKQYFEVNPFIAYDDFVTLIYKWVIQFYPYYEVKVEFERGLTPEEINDKRIQMIKAEKSFHLDDYLEVKVIDSKMEKGIIIEVILKKNEFVIEIDGKRYLHRMKSSEDEYSLSNFLRSLRDIEGEYEKRKFIYDSSNLVDKLYEKEKEIIIDYDDEQLLNFFKINFEILKDKKLVYLKDDERKSKDKLYKWGKYLIKFSNNLICKDCLDWYKKEIKTS